ncbi:MAG TPA: hypothetical protein PLE45_04495 [Spirochaetota bacterium]|nr:hypothetical protein [Spirochaetota bacterium]HOL57576.1 hypothetical protein [Spirochaetota bacterium]HPP05144.1 hypothetical protein [Spirochaetota bacterium]
MSDPIEDKIKKIINASDNKKLEIGYESYGSCCIVVPKFTLSILKDNKTITTSALSIEDCCDNLIEEIE